MQFNPETDLRIERRFQAAPDRIWRCLTEPALIEAWFAPRPVVTRDVSLDLRPGGSFRSVMDVPGHGEMPGHGCVLEVVPGRRLVWTDLMRGGWHPNDGSFGFTAVMEVLPDGAGSLYRANALHRTAAQKAEHEKMGFHEGWGAAADQLGELALTL
ncbi:SRPBCC family protein [Pseudomonas sp. GX19020]|uniref:SRPBCC family protein n=1 Tax=Pseudomonas sp. GX19020 TaxID=2942277 RepID=UPI002019F055|nr:SRPBCC family protein [Pseudomonas sp. GX19020]MCL4065014.1 SRPBCC family protein [Pseudomonas sp. GX19020]